MYNTSEKCIKNKSYSLVNMVKKHYNSITYYAFL